MMIDPRIPEAVQPILKEYLRRTETRLVGLIQAIYLVGSIALGEFNEQFSDIDFITILNRKATSLELEHLRNVHQAIENQHPRWKMSGRYIQESDLGKTKESLALHPHVHDGTFHLAVRDGINWVTWWELKNGGIPMVGPEPRTLPFTVDRDLLMTEMRENLNSYWRSWTRQPRQVMILYSDWGIQWAVLGVLRQFYTFRENSITTKMRAGEYALECLPEAWHPLIQEAIYIRQGKKNSSYRFRFGRMLQAIHFLDYIIDTCNVESRA